MCNTSCHGRSSFCFCHFLLSFLSLHSSLTLHRLQAGLGKAGRVAGQLALVEGQSVAAAAIFLPSRIETAWNWTRNAQSRGEAKVKIISFLFLSLFIFMYTLFVIPYTFSFPSLFRLVLLLLALSVLFFLSLLHNAVFVSLLCTCGILTYSLLLSRKVPHRCRAIFGKRTEYSRPRRVINRPILYYEQ